MSFGIQQERGRPITVKDDGLSLTGNVGSIDFAGAGVVGTALGPDITETISGEFNANTETPTGVINDVNTIFTLAHTPNTNTLLVFLNGAFQTPTDDYTIVTSTITFVIPPATGSILRVFYQY